MSKLEDKLTASIKANRGSASKKSTAKMTAPKKTAPKVAVKSQAKIPSKVSPTPENSKSVERKSSHQELHPRRVWPD